MLFASTIALGIIVTFAILFRRRRRGDEAAKEAPKGATKALSERILDLFFRPTTTTDVDDVRMAATVRVEDSEDSEDSAMESSDVEVEEKEEEEKEEQEGREEKEEETDDDVVSSIIAELTQAASIDEAGASSPNNVVESEDATLLSLEEEAEVESETTLIPEEPTDEDASTTRLKRNDTLLYLYFLQC